MAASEVNVTAHNVFLSHDPAEKKRVFGASAKACAQLVAHAAQKHSGPKTWAVLLAAAAKRCPVHSPSSHSLWLGKRSGTQSTWISLRLPLRAPPHRKRRLNYRHEDYRGSTLCSMIWKRKRGESSEPRRRGGKLKPGAPSAEASTVL